MEEPEFYFHRVLRNSKDFSCITVSKLLYIAETTYDLLGVSQRS